MPTHQSSDFKLSAFMCIPKDNYREPIYCELSTINDMF